MEASYPRPVRRVPTKKSRVSSDLKGKKKGEENKGEKVVAFLKKHGKSLGTAAMEAILAEVVGAIASKGVEKGGKVLTKALVRAATKKH
jgi:hypothetical protein